MSIKKIFAASLIVSSLFISYGVFAQADPTVTRETQSSAGANITFPVPELGNCTSKDECKAYCADTSHMEACIAFAEAHGLMNKDEANQAKQFKSGLQAGGPGGCNSPDACKSYCSDTTHLEECVAFAKKHGIKNKGIEHSEKISTYLKSGGTLPGNCTSKDACEAYCHDFSHAEECMAFAKKVGAPIEHGPPPKLLELMKSGQTPGGCTSRDACEAYCRDESHRDECIAFAEKAGLMKPDEAQKLKELNGKGPGGCDSPVTCRAYCNDALHRDECYKFAEEHNLIPKEQLEETKQGLVRMRQGLENMPPEVAACVKSSLGESAVNDLESGKLVPGPDFGEKIKNCFEKFGGSVKQKNGFSNLPPDAKACVQAKLGADFDAITNGTVQPTPEMGDAVRVCFGQVHLMQGGPQGGPNGAGHAGQQGGNPGMGQFIKNAPPQIQECIKTNLGDQYDAVIQGTLSTVDMKDKLRSCFEQFKPEHPGMMQGGGPSEGPNMIQQGMSFDGAQGKPDTMKRCMVQVFGAEAEAQMNTGAFKNDPGLRAKLEACMKTAGGGEHMMSPSPQGGNNQGSVAMPDAMKRCLAQILGVASDAHIDTSALKDRPELQEKLRMCMGGQGGGTPGKPPVQDSNGEGGSPNPGSRDICPKMPTVDSCPEGQMKKQVYSSPECGTYYACVPGSYQNQPPTGNPPDPSQYPSKLPSQYQYPQQGEPPQGGMMPPQEKEQPPPEDVKPPLQTNERIWLFLGNAIESVASFFVR